MATHKILVRRDTGKIVTPIHEVDDLRPEPPDQMYVILEEDNIIHQHMVHGADLGKIDLGESYWNFETNSWVFVEATPMKVEQLDALVKGLLNHSNTKFQHLTDPTEIEAWKTYRQKLRDLIPNNAGKNAVDVKIPRSPDEVAKLKELARNGDAASQKTVEEEGL